MGIQDNPIFGPIFNKVKNTMDEAGKGADDIGTGLAQRQKMSDGAFDKSEPAKPAAAAPAPKGPGRYGDRPGEKRLDVSSWTKPLGGAPVYHKGVASVPKTGPAILEKGEKVVPKGKNPDNPDRDEPESKDNAVEEATEHTPAEKAHFHRAMSHLHNGGLHRHLGISEDKPIPMAKKQEAATSDNPHVAAMGRLALAMHGWKHGK